MPKSYSAHGRPADQQELPPDTLKSRLFGEMLHFINRVTCLTANKATHFFESSQFSSPTPDFDLSTARFTLRLLPSMSLRVLRLKVLKTLKLPPQSKIQMWLALERGTLREFAEMDMELADKPVEWWGAEDNSKIVYHAQ